MWAVTAPTINNRNFADMQIEVLKSKIHRVTITQANLDLSLIHIYYYEGVTQKEVEAYYGKLIDHRDSTPSLPSSLTSLLFRPYEMGVLSRWSISLP